MSPKTAAVLADTPAFFLEFAFAFRGLQRPLRLTGGAILIGIKLREMPADDFLRKIALDTLRTEIPVGDVALGIEHVNGVVGDALHQEPELLFAEPQHPLGFFALGEIARDLGVTDDVAGRGPDRINDDAGPEPAAVFADAPAFVLE